MIAARQYLSNHPMRDRLPGLIFGNALYFEHVKALSVGYLFSAMNQASIMDAGGP